MDSAAVLGAFTTSAELERLPPGDRELVWVEELLETMESAGWSWAELDLEIFEAVLLDGLGWTIERAPDDPGRVARVLAAFLEFAVRRYGAPHAAECRAYLESDRAVKDIARWVRPFDELAPDPLFAELSAPYNWCDGRCDRCALAARCPVGEVEASALPGGAARAADPEAARAAALAAAHMLAAREQLDRDQRRAPRPAGSEAAARLRQACRDYGAALMALRESLVDAGLGGDTGELGADAMLVAVKGERLAGYLSPSGALEAEPALKDGVPNLFLLDRVVADVDRRLAAMPELPGRAAAYRAARDALGDRLQALLRGVPLRHREEMRARALSGSAPSPFACLP